MSTETTYTWRIPAEVTVTVPGSDEDEATYDEAVSRVEAALQSMATGYGTNGVRAWLTIDSAGPDEVREATS